MKNKRSLSKFTLFRACAARYLGMISLVFLLLGFAGITSCGRKSQAQEDEANLKLVGYNLDQAGFLKAVMNDDVQALQIFKERGFDLNQKDEQGRAAIYIAAESGSARAIHFLAKLGAEIEEADDDGVTPLMAAARAGKAGNNEAILYLLEKGADARRKDKIGKFALIHAMDGKSMEAVHLIAPKTRKLLDTGILYAADMDYHEMIPVLVKYGASVYARSSGKTSLMIAAERGNEKAAKALLDEGANLYAVSDEGMLAQDYAEGNDSMLAALLGSMPDTDADPLVMEWSDKELEQLVHKAIERSELEKTSAINAGADSKIVTSEVSKEKIMLQRIKGKNLPLEFNNDMKIEEQMTMASYAEKTIPLTVKMDETGKIQIFDHRKKQATQPTQNAEQKLGQAVKEGSEVGMTGLRVKQIKKKIVNNKLTGGSDQELVTLIIEDEKTGQIKEFYADYKEQVAEAVAVIKLNGSGEFLIVERGDEFYDINRMAYKVMDVNDEEVIIEHIESGKQSLLPLMGIKR